MIKGRKIGVILILIGIGILFVLFQYDSSEVFDIDWGPIYIPFTYFFPLVIGVILVLVGIGKVIFSFFPKEAKSKK